MAVRSTAPPGVRPAAAGRRLPLRPVILALSAVVVFQVLFGAAYLMAFKNSVPTSLPFAVTSRTPEAAHQIAAALRDGSEGRLDTRVVVDETTARTQLLDRDVTAALVIRPVDDLLLVASATSPTLAQQLIRDVSQREEARGRQLAVEDLASLPSNDPRGLMPFYLVIAWVMGGYLGATVLGLTAARMGAHRHVGAAERLAGLAIYAVASAAALTAVAAATVGIVTDRWLTVASVGSLIVFASAATTAALQALLGVMGTGVVLLLFVVVGNPSSGGPVARELLPGLLRDIGGYLPPGAGVDILRATLYLDGHAQAGALFVLATWAALGTVATVALGRVRRPPAAEAELETEVLVASG